MKLAEVTAEKQFQVYEITGDHTGYSYIGYADAGKDPLKEFLKHAKRAGAPSDAFPAAERGAAKLIVDNNNETDSLKGETVEVFDNELDAFMERNQMRAREKWRSISGPTMFPTGVAKRAAKEHPEKVAAWGKIMDDRKHWEEILHSKTARKAYELGAWKYDDLKPLKAKHPSAEVAKDLDGLSPSEFAKKYDLKLQPPRD